MRFFVTPRDVPPAQAAKKLGIETLAQFEAALPNLIARGFPRADPDTGNFDLEAIDRWQDARHPHLFNGGAGGFAARDASSVASDRIAALRSGRR